ncbi:MAG: PorT family protein [Flavobacteriales bacterium]|nr:PorT family protein [Flavobacteriales bacterium]
MRTSILFVFLLTITASWAQSGLGVKAGGNYSFLSMMKGKDWPSNAAFDYVNDHVLRRTLAFSWGYTARIQLAKWLDLSPELFCSRTLNMDRTGETNYQDQAGNHINWRSEASSTVTMRYVELPVLLGFKMPFGLRVEMGPVGSAMVHYSSAYESKSTWYTNGAWTGSDEDKDKVDGDAEKGGFNLFEFAVAGGLNYELRNGLNFGARYQRGLTTVTEDSDLVEYYYNLVQLSLGFTFLGKRGAE